MKKTLGALLLILGVFAPAWGLDSQKLTTLEIDLGDLLLVTNPTVLQALENKFGPAAALPGTNALDQVKAGIISHNLSRALNSKGVTGNAAKAVDRLKGPARGTDPELAALALAVLGSATTLQGAEDWNPGAKVNFVNQGWALLTEAVDKYGAETFLPRFLRANVAAGLPDFLGKGPQGLEDLQALDAWDKTHPGRLSDGLRASIALMEGNCFKKDKKMDQALAAWSRAAALDPQKTGAGKAAAENLDRYGS